MNVDFLHNQIIRDTISPKFIESFNENLLPLLCLKYGENLEYVQLYEDHLADGFRINGIFYYPLTVVVSGVARTEWISWQVSNYRHYDNFNPYTYNGQEFLEFKLLDSVPGELLQKIEGKPIFSPGTNLPLILTVASEDKTFLKGRYSQGFIDQIAAQITEAIEEELSIVGLAGSGVLLEMNFTPGTFMEHISENTTYRRLRIKARACSARDLWIKWTRLDGKGTYTISDNVDRSMIKVELAEDVPGKIKEREYRYLTSVSINKYQSSMGRKHITEWREMMRRVIRRGEVEKFEKIKISKPKMKDEEELIAELVPVGMAAVSAVTIPTAQPQVNDDITEKLNALLGKSGNDVPAEPVAKNEDDDINSDLSELLRGALGKETATDSFAKTEPDVDTESADIQVSEAKSEATSDDPEVVARIRRELESKMQAEMQELRKKNAEADELRAKLEAQERAETRGKELLIEAARALVLDKEKREADRRAEEERDRLEAERKAAEAARIAEERRREEEAKAEQARIEKELEAARARKAAEKAAEKAKAVPPKQKYVSKTVNLIFKRGGVDKSMTKRVHEVILATIKYLHKEDVYMRIKANIPDPTTLTLVFSEIPENEQQLIVDIIQVLGKSNLGITKATLE